MDERIFKKALATIADLTDIGEDDILSEKKQQRVFYAKVVLSHYLKDNTDLPLRDIADLLHCSHPALIARLKFFSKTRRFAWKYEPFARLNALFNEKMKDTSQR